MVTHRPPPGGRSARVARAARRGCLQLQRSQTDRTDASQRGCQTPCLCFVYRPAPAPRVGPVPGKPPMLHRACFCWCSRQLSTGHSGGSGCAWWRCDTHKLELTTCMRWKCRCRRCPKTLSERAVCVALGVAARGVGFVKRLGIKQEVWVSHTHVATPPPPPTTCHSAHPHGSVDLGMGHDLLWVSVPYVLVWILVRTSRSLARPKSAICDGRCTGGKGRGELCAWVAVCAVRH